jgi:hypothetical protein
MLLIAALAAVSVLPTTVAGAQEMAAVEPQREVMLPGWVMDLLEFFSQKYVLPFSAALAAALITVVGVLRQVLALFGAKLGTRGVLIATAFLAAVTAFLSAASDGQVAGEEWTVILTAVLSFLGAIIGYRVTFSRTARDRLGKF